MCPVATDTLLSQINGGADDWKTDTMQGQEEEGPIDIKGVLLFNWKQLL